MLFVQLMSMDSLHVARRVGRYYTLHYASTRQRRSQDFFGGGPIFRDLRRPTRFGGGGGVVAEIFRDRRKPGRFSRGGGGGSSRIFLGSPITMTQPHSVGGGAGSGRIFCVFW